MKRRRGRPLTAADERAVERVEHILGRIAEQDAPLWISDSQPRSGLHLAAVRRLANQRADEACRGDMLAGARERVSRAYALRVGDMSLWSAVTAGSLPYSARDRADSQAVLQDLVTAAVTEDLLPWSAVRRLREDGERLLDIAVTDASDPPAEGPVRAPPEDPFIRPLVPAGGVARFLGAVLLVGLSFSLVAGATSDAGLGVLAAAAIAISLLISVSGPRRQQPGR